VLVTVAATPTQSPSSAEALALLLLEACDRQRQEIARLVAERSALEEANQALVVERDELRQRNEELKRRRDSTPRTRPSRRRAMA
jgi:regulator of replication initiation timing